MAMYPAFPLRETPEDPARNTPCWCGRLDAQRNAAAAMWFAPGALERLGDARRLVEQAGAELAETGECVQVDDLGWRWPGWVDVALAPSGYGLTVRYGKTRMEDPDAPALRPLSVRSPALERVVDDWIAVRWPPDHADRSAIRVRANLVRTLMHLLARHPAIRACERSALAALAIPPAVLRLARKIERCQPRAAHRQLRARSLDVAWRHFSTLQRAQRENPVLFPLLGALAADQGLRLEIDPVRQLREWCRFRGLSKSEWAELARDGTDAYRWALQLVGDRVSHLDLVIGLIRIERALGQRLGELDRDLRISWLAHLDPWRMRPEIEHAIRLFARTSTSLAEALTTLALLHHGLDAELVQSTDMLAVRGWHALRGQLVSALLQRDRHVENDPRFAGHLAIGRIDQEMTATEWLQSLAVAATDLVAWRLTDAGAITAEGEAMFHCIANYTQVVARGRYLVYTLRGPEHQRVATLGIRKQGTRQTKNVGWDIDQVRGIADRPAPESARRMAKLVLDACRSAAGPPECFYAPPAIEGTDAWVGDGE